MQLGTRWASGTVPPASVPELLREAIAAVDSQTDASENAFWTLTWLEGRPIAELDSGVEVFQAADGRIVSRPFQD